MKKSLLTTSLAAIYALALVGCDVEQTRDGDLPTVDVDGGTMPAYDVDGPEIDITSEESKISVPDVSVEMEEKSVTTPNVDITLPDDE